MMKPSYLLGATPAFLVLFAVGLMQCERNELVKRTVAAVFGVLFLLATMHLLQIGLAGVAAQA